MSLEIETSKNVFELPKPPHYKSPFDHGNIAFISEEDKKLQGCMYLTILLL